MTCPVSRVERISYWTNTVATVCIVWSMELIFRDCSGGPTLGSGSAVVSTQCWLWWSYLPSTMRWHADKYCSNGMRNFLSSSQLAYKFASHGCASRCLCDTNTQCDNMSVTLWHVTLSPLRHTQHFNWRRIWQWGRHNQCDLHCTVRAGDTDTRCCPQQWDNQQSITT